MEDDEWRKKERAEDIRVAYAAAINLWGIEGELSWSRFNAMLVVNSIFIAILGFLATADKIQKFISLSLPILGVLLCVAWSSLMARSFSNIKYWVLSARELEGLLPSEQVKIVSRGGAAADGEPVTLFFEGRTHTHRRSVLGGVTMHTISQFVVLIFVALYAIAFIQMLYW